MDILVASQPKWAINHVARLDLALREVGPVGLQLERLKADMASPQLAQLIKQDMHDAVTLKISRTPEFLVNGKLLATLGRDELRTMVQQALHEAYGVPGARK